MAFPGSNSHLGVHANDAAANAKATALGWTLSDGFRYYDSTLDVMKVYDGASWDELPTGAAAATAIWGGDDTDGNVTLSSGTTSLSRDTRYGNLTLSGSAILQTEGYKIFCETLDVSGLTTGYIDCIGGDGSPGDSGAAGGAGGVGGTASPTGSTGVKATPLDGGDGGLGQVGNGQPGTSNSPSPQVAGARRTTAGTAGADGGDGGPGTASAGAGGTGSSGNAGLRIDAANGDLGSVFNDLRWADDLGNRVTGIATGDPGGAGGGGGGGGDSFFTSGGDGGGAGGGGAPGGHLAIVAKTIITGSYAGYVRATGGDGGDGGAGEDSAGSKGPGGGGASGPGGPGGVVIEIYASKTGTGTIDVSGGAVGSAGAAGTGGGGGASAGSVSSAGPAGLHIEHVL